MDEKFTFPRETLTKYFRYFRNALQTKGDESLFVEGEANHEIHLQEIKAEVFSHLFQYVTGDLRHRESCNYKLTTNITTLLEAIIAADYLHLDCEEWNFGGFTNSIHGMIRQLLLGDHSKVVVDHVQLVQTHPAFQSKKIWRLFAKAGVRPYLQQYMLFSSHMDSELSDLVPIGYQTVEDWYDVIRHHIKLRQANDQYALEVMKEVSRTLFIGREEQRRSGDEVSEAVCYTDPLYKTIEVGSKRKRKAPLHYTFAV